MAAQIRPRKPTIYVPAALRKTERPRCSPPKTAPDSPLDSSGSSAHSVAPDDDGVGLSRAVPEELSAGPLSPVAGPPSRNHWKPDRSADACSAAACRAPFSLFRRRHHCRRCGAIFCHAHCAHAVPLNEHALFHPDGAPQRACDRCHRHYYEWEQLRARRASAAPETAALHIAPEPRKRPDARGSLASSFPGNFNWSTF